MAYSLAHHLGSLPDGLGAAGRGTRVADWLDLLVPFVVLLPALGTLLAAGVSRATYLWFAVGSWLYATGHGVHLAANSIGNVAPGETAHLWDEQVGPLGLVRRRGRRRRDAGVRPWSSGRCRRHALAWLLAVAVGLTWGTNATGGEFTWAGPLLAAVAAGVGAGGTARDSGCRWSSASAVAGVVAVLVSAIVR